jgi:hypothetical protein
MFNDLTTPNASVTPNNPTNPANPVNSSPGLKDDKGVDDIFADTDKAPVGTKKFTGYYSNGPLEAKKVGLSSVVDSAVPASNGKNLAIKIILFSLIGLLVIIGGYFIHLKLVVGNQQAARINNPVAVAPVNNNTTANSDEVVSSTPVSTPAPISSSTIVSSSTTAPIATTSLPLSQQPTIAPAAPIATSTPSAANLIDTDGDGLTDVEEALLGTDPTKADTNGNGFPDLTELRNGYDPIKAGVRLSSSSAVMFYNFNNAATLVYPSTWSATENDTKDAVVFANNSQSTIKLSVQANSQSFPDITTWFQAEFNGLTSGGSVSGPGWQGVYSPDQLTVYLMGTKTDKVYILSYSPAANDNPSIITFFHIMVKTLTIK